MRFPKPFIAALAAGVAAAPGAAVLAADAAGLPPLAGTPVSAEGTGIRSLHAPLAGDPTATAAMRGHARDRAVREHVRAAAHWAGLSGRRFSHAATIRRARAVPPSALARATRELRAEARELDVAIPPVMHRIAQCESHGDPRAIGGGGTFRGALQFMQSTWESVGGEGDPTAAPLEEQLRRGAMLMARSGSSPWPHCGA